MGQVQLNVGHIINLSCEMKLNLYKETHVNSKLAILNLMETVRQKRPRFVVEKHQQSKENVHHSYTHYAKIFLINESSLGYETGWVATALLPYHYHNGVEAHLLYHPLSPTTISRVSSVPGNFH